MIHYENGTEVKLHNRRIKVFEKDSDPDTIHVEFISLHKGREVNNLNPANFKNIKFNDKTSILLLGLRLSKAAAESLYLQLQKQLHGDEMEFIYEGEEE